MHCQQIFLQPIFFKTEHLFVWKKKNRNATTYISVTYYIRYLDTPYSNIISSYKGKRIKNFKTAVNSISQI